MKIKNLVTCLKIITSEGEKYYFCDSDHDIEINNEKYLHGVYFIPGKITSSTNLEENNFKIIFIIDGYYFEKNKLISGYYSNSFVEISLVDSFDINLKKHILKTGYLGAISLKDNSFIAEISSLISLAKNNITKCYLSNCRAKLGDDKCKIKLEKYTAKGKVENLADINSFYDSKREEGDDYFKHGEISFLSGKLAGRNFWISNFYNEKIIIQSLEELEINIGDEYQIIAGCNKDFNTCITKFNNAINFRGEPFIPNRHQLVV